MATATMATAAGAAALFYYTLNRKLLSSRLHDVENESSDVSSTQAPLRGDRVSHRLIQAPGTWVETISTLSETLRFTYSETLGKWPIGDLAFGISFLLKRQDMVTQFYIHYGTCTTDAIEENVEDRFYGKQYSRNSRGTFK